MVINKVIEFLEEYGDDLFFIVVGFVWFYVFFVVFSSYYEVYFSDELEFFSCIDGDWDDIFLFGIMYNFRKIGVENKLDV